MVSICHKEVERSHWKYRPGAKRTISKFSTSRIQRFGGQRTEHSTKLITYLIEKYSGLTKKFTTTTLDQTKRYTNQNKPQKN